jgi:hypothetical protein
MSPKRLEGFVDNGRGEPAADLPAVATIAGTSTVVDTTITDADGYWLFTDLPVADEYVVTLTDTAGNAVARAPWSGELREAWVRDRLDVAGKPVLIDPAAGNSLTWTATGLYAVAGLTQAAADLRYEPIDTMYTKAESDARYPQKTDVDPYPNYLTSTEADALFLTPAEGNTAYASSAHNHDATYVQLVGGSVMTGLLGPSTHNTRDLGTTGTRWRALYGMTGDFTTSLTVATKPITPSPDAANIIEFRANGLYAAAGAVTDIWVNTGGDTMTGDLNMTANVLPTVTNTRDLGSTSLRWRKVWATDADFTNVPTVGGSALVTVGSADASYVKLVGGTMTGLLSVQKDADDDLLRLITARPTTGTGARLRLRRARGTVALPTELADGDDLGAIIWEGRTTGGAWTPIASLQANAVGPAGASYHAARFFLATSNGTTAPTTRMEVDNAGRIWVNRISATDPVYAFGPQLVIQRDATGTTEWINTQAYTTAGDPIWSHYTASGSAASLAQLTSGRTVHSIEAWAFNSGWRRTTRLMSVVDAAPGASWTPGRWSVWVTNGSGTETERLRIASDGATAITGALTATVPAGSTNPITGQSPLSILTGGQGQLVAYDDTTMAIDVGGTLAFRGKYTAGGTTAGFGGIKMGKSNATDGNLDTYLAFYTRSNATAITERLRIDNAGAVWLPSVSAFLEMGAVGSANTPGIDFHSSANTHDYDVRLIASGGTATPGTGLLTVGGNLMVQGNIGFYNTAASAKPTITGSRGANAALTDLLTKLATLGLIVNSTS